MNFASNSVIYLLLVSCLSQDQNFVDIIFLLVVLSVDKFDIYFTAFI